MLISKFQRKDRSFIISRALPVMSAAFILLSLNNQAQAVSYECTTGTQTTTPTIWANTAYCGIPSSETSNARLIFTATPADPVVDTTYLATVEVYGAEYKETWSCPIGPSGPAQGHSFPVGTLTFTVQAADEEREGPGSYQDNGGRMTGGCDYSKVRLK